MIWLFITIEKIFQIPDLIRLLPLPRYYMFHRIEFLNVNTNNKNSYQSHRYCERIIKLTHLMHNKATEIGAITSNDFWKLSWAIRWSVGIHAPLKLVRIFLPAKYIEFNSVRHLVVNSSIKVNFFHFIEMLESNFKPNNVSTSET